MIKIEEKYDFFAANLKRIELSEKIFEDFFNRTLSTSVYDSPSTFSK